MTDPAVRRSRRQTWANYTSFGRDYLAQALGWPRPHLDKWLLSSTVHSHLLFWHSTCVERPRRFNEAIEWINTGYFDKDCNFEEDVLLLCLEEGSQGSEVDAGGAECKTYADQTAQTYKWTTIELWARSVWRIVQDNCGKGAIFENAVKYHPAAACGIVFDMLCIAFHNIAYVGPESVWSNIINNACIPTTALTPCTQSISVAVSSLVAQQIALDTDPDATSEDGVEYFDEVLDDDGMFIDDGDSDFSSVSAVETVSVFVETPKKNRGPVGRKTSPTAPAKTSGGNKRAHVGDDEVTPFKKVKQWMQSVSSQEPPEREQNVTLNIFDEEGRPITGYRSASNVQPPAMQHPILEKPSVGEEDVIVLRRDSGVWDAANADAVDGSADEVASGKGCVSQ